MICSYCGRELKDGYTSLRGEKACWDCTEKDRETSQYNEWAARQRYSAQLGATREILEVTEPRDLPLNKPLFHSELPSLPDPEDEKEERFCLNCGQKDGPHSFELITVGRVTLCNWCAERFGSAADPSNRRW